MTTATTSPISPSLIVQQDCDPAEVFAEWLHPYAKADLLKNLKKKKSIVFVISLTDRYIKKRKIASRQKNLRETS
jgi:hypothetical protein